MGEEKVAAAKINILFQSNVGSTYGGHTWQQPDAHIPRYAPTNP